MKRDDTQLTNEIYNKTHTVPGSFETPLDSERVRKHARVTGHGFKAELGPEDEELWSDKGCPPSDTERAHEGITSR